MGTFAVFNQKVFHEQEYTQAFFNPDIVEHLKRGELFVLGRRYLSGHISVELHPLFNVFLTVINNLADPSGILQPRAIWDITQDVQLTFGGNVFYGAKDTEFGGFRIPDTDLLNKPSDSGFLWLTYFSQKATNQICLVSQSELLSSSPIVRLP